MTATERQTDQGFDVPKLLLKFTGILLLVSVHMPMGIASLNAGRSRDMKSAAVLPLVYRWALRWERVRTRLESTGWAEPELESG